MSDEIKAVDSLPVELQDAIKDAAKDLPPVASSDNTQQRVWVEHTVLEDEKLGDFVTRFGLNIFDVVADAYNQILFKQFLESENPVFLPQDFPLTKGTRVRIGLTPQGHADYNVKMFDSLHKRMDAMENQLHITYKNLDRKD